MCALLVLNFFPTVYAALAPVVSEQDFKMIIKDRDAYDKAFYDYFLAVISDNANRADAQKALDRVRDTLENGNDPRAEGAITRTKINSYNDTLLHWARNAEMVQFLIDKGADVHAKTGLGYDPLMKTMYYTPNLALIKALLDNGASLSTTNNAGETPLDHVNKGLKTALESGEAHRLIQPLTELKAFLTSYL